MISLTPLRNCETPSWALKDQHVDACHVTAVQPGDGKEDLVARVQVHCRNEGELDLRSGADVGGVEAEKGVDNKPNCSELGDGSGRDGSSRSRA
eukprot:758079-Hanusia_phi.AAC.1